MGSNDYYPDYARTVCGDSPQGMKKLPAEKLGREIFSERY
jgi:hypothetical protein